MFSSRLPASLVPTPLATAVAAARRDRAAHLRDLTLSNPTLAGLAYPETLAAAWSNVDALRYAPEPRGLRDAREAVAAWYASIGEPVDPDHLVLTSSTSEGYSHVFKLLCEPGDEVLVPCPSYPLFEHLARLDGITAVHYASRDVGSWVLDESDLAARLTSRSRVLVVVAPNNPTGHVPSTPEWQALGDVCRRHGLVLVIDEVFSAYPLTGGASHVPIPTVDGVLTFRLNGLSKLIGLPGAKLGWMRVSGPTERVDAALAGLDLIADTYLSVSTPVQVALPALLAAGATVRDQIRRRLLGNLATVAQAVAGTAIDLRVPDGGWSVVLRVPAVGDGEHLAQALLARDVLVHPGYFYDLPHDGYLVLSLLSRERDVQEGIETLCTLPIFQLT